MMLSKKSSRWAGARALLLLPLTGLALGAFAQTAYVYPEDKVKKENVTIRVDGRKISPDGRKPLILADGREVASMDSLDVDRIESITVLKDSAAVTAYGERGRAGVILVTMKKPGDAASKGASSARLDEVRVVGFGTLPREELMTGDSSQRIHIRMKQAEGANGRVLSVTGSSGRGRGKTSKSFRWSPGAKSSQSVVYTINGTRVSQADIESIDPDWIESISIVENDGEKSAADTAATDVRIVKITTKSPGTIAKEGMNRAAMGMEAALKGLKGNRALSPEELDEARRALETTKKALDEAQRELDAAEKETSAQVTKIQSVQAVAFGAEDGISVQGSTGNVASFSWNQSRLNSALSGKKLVYINGARVSKGAVRRLDPDKILHVEIYKGERAVQKFGEKGRNGVVEIRTRK